MKKEYLDIKVTKINKRWHARLFNINTGFIYDEMACECIEGIGWICTEMLRWHDKCGGMSPMAQAARRRKSIKLNDRIREDVQILFTGKVWYLGNNINRTAAMDNVGS